MGTMWGDLVQRAVAGGSRRGGGGGGEEPRSSAALEQRGNNGHCPPSSSQRFDLAPTPNPRPQPPTQALDDLGHVWQAPAGAQDGAALQVDVLHSGPRQRHRLVAPVVKPLEAVAHAQDVALGHAVVERLRRV